MCKCRYANGQFIPLEFNLNISEFATLGTANSCSNDAADKEATVVYKKPVILGQKLGPLILRSVDSPSDPNERINIYYYSGGGCRVVYYYDAGHDVATVCYGTTYIDPSGQLSCIVRSSCFQYAHALIGA